MQNSQLSHNIIEEINISNGINLREVMMLKYFFPLCRRRRNNHLHFWQVTTRNADAFPLMFLVRHGNNN